MFILANGCNGHFEGEFCQGTVENIQTPRDTGKAPRLIRALGLWSAIAVIVGSMIGQAVFLVASDMARELGSPTRVLAVWIIGGIVVLFGTFCYAELGAAMPEAGGDYVYLSRGLSPVCGFLFGWTSSMIMRPGGAAVTAAGLLRFTGFLLPSVANPIFTWNLTLPFQLQPYQFTFTAAQPLAAGIIVLLTAINYLGVRTAGHFQIFLTSLKVAAVVAIVILGLTLGTLSGIHPALITSAAQGSTGAILMALVPAMAAYNGFQMLGPLGGEVSDPQRNIPRAVIVGSLLVISLYVLINWTYFHILGFSRVAESHYVASDAVALLIGNRGAKWITVAMIVSAFGALHASFLSGPRVPYAMARDSHFFRFAGRIQPVFHTPSGALIFQGCIAILLVLTGTYQELYSFQMFAIWGFFGLIAIALIRLRRKKPALPRSYREGIKRTKDVDLSKSVRRTSGRKLDFFIIAVLLLVIGILLFQRLHPNISPTVSSSLKKSIAVLPFENLSEEKANAYFADGIQGEILTKLAGIGDLKVISRSSTAKYKSKPEDLKTVAHELGVATVLEGTVQKAGNRVRVNVQLLDARVDTHLWAKSYDRDLKDVFAVESEVAQEVADTLRAKLSPSQTDALATAPTRDTEAYDLFLKGENEEHQAESALSAEAFDRAAMFYQQALARDPKFALAYARLAYSELYRHWFISNLTSAELAEVKSNIERALAIAPASTDAHLALALFYYWGYRDYDAGLRELDRALELQPSSSNSRNYRASIYRRRGEWQRALAEFDRAAELDPRDPLNPYDMGVTYLSLRRWSDAEHAFARALALDPHYALAAQDLALTYINSTGDIGRARRAFEGVPTESKVSDASDWGSIAVMIDHRVYLDVFEKHFADALKAWDTPPSNTPEARLRHLEARIGIQVLAGQGAVAKSECEQTRALLESRLAERPEDRISLTALAWVYVCLGRNADAVRVARQAADLLPIEKDALSGPFLLSGLAEIEARTGQSEDAIKIIRQLITAPAGQFISIARLKIDPVWDPIRNDPGFQKLISEPEPATIYK